MHTHRLVRKVGAALDRFLPSLQGTLLGVAVSGGPDSVALLSALTALVPERGFSLSVLHVNHGLRQEADEEQYLVEALCRRWRFPFMVGSLTPPSSGKGVESWARVERYRFFRAVRDQQKLNAVAVAHTLDDQAETVLFRLLRGSARRGLAGIPPIREGWIIRPLLDCTRQEVMEYLTAQNLAFATDSSNTDMRYARNKIRHRLLPLLEQEFSPQIRQHLATLAHAFREEETWLEDLAVAARARVQDSPLTLSLSRLSTEPEALRSRILRQWLEQTAQAHEVSSHHLESLRALSAGHMQGSIDIPGDFYVRREGTLLQIEMKRKRSSSLQSQARYCYGLAPGQKIMIQEGGWQVTVTPPFDWNGPSEQARSTDPWQALFDAEAITGAMFVRNFRSGDRICPFGMRGHKKVHDVFVDAKVPSSRRHLLPLVVVGAEIAWVPGCVRGEAAKITDTTRRVCRMSVIPLPEK